MSSWGVPTRFKSLTYTAIIVNPVSYFLMKMHGHIRLFTYPSFSKYPLRWLYHMRPDCFNLYKDHCNLIEYMLRGFILFASSNLNQSRIFKYISLSMDLYKYQCFKNWTGPANPTGPTTSRSPFRSGPVIWTGWGSSRGRTGRTDGPTGEPDELVDSKGTGRFNWF